MAASKGFILHDCIFVTLKHESIVTVKRPVVARGQRWGSMMETSPPPCFFFLLGMKPRASQMLGKCSDSKLHSMTELF